MNEVMADLIGTPDQFVAAREYAGFSTRGLADEVARELRKDRRKPIMGCSRSMVSNLENGKVTRTNYRRAAAIEKVLKLPQGHMFRVEMFNAQLNSARQPA